MYVVKASVAQQSSTRHVQYDLSRLHNFMKVQGESVQQATIVPILWLWKTSVLLTTHNGGTRIFFSLRQPKNQGYYQNNFFKRFKDNSIIL
jgi:hypothetical protein